MPVPPNKIKYSTSFVANALKAKNFAIGSNVTVDYGPTSTTGFWNGIKPPVGGYVIYLNKASQGPSIYVASNDTELINLTKYISGTNITSVNEAITWFAGQTDKICINSDYFDIVTDGLVLNLDSSYTMSYPRSGTTWYDMSFSGYNATLLNSPSFTLSGNGYINFQSSSSQYATFSDLGNLNNFTCEVWTKQNTLPSSGSYPAFIANTFPGPAGNLLNYSLGYNKAPWDGKIYGGFFNGSWQLNSSGFTPTTDQWYHYAVTYDGSKILFYVDGKYYSSASTTTTALTSGAGGRLMRRWDDTNYIDGHLLNAKVYKRAISSSEILQNFNAHGTPIGVISDGLIMQLDAANILSYPRTGTLWKSLVSSVQNNGTLTNSPTFSSDNLGSFIFDGSNDYVSLPLNFFDHDDGSPFSVSIWFKTSTSGGTLFGQQDTTTPSSASGYVPAIYINSQGKIVTSCFWGGSTSNTTVSSTNVADGLWHNIVVTFALSSHTTYLDSVSIGTISKTQTNYSANYYYFLGAGYSNSWSLVNGYYFTGNISYMSFYNVQLTSSQVSQNYNALSYRHTVTQDVTPDTVNWADISFDGSTLLRTVAVQQITGISTQITLNLTYGSFVGNTMYYRIDTTAPSWSNGGSTINFGSWTSFASNTNININNNEYLSFGCQGGNDVTVTLTVKNTNDNNTILDTINATVISN